MSIVDFPKRSTNEIRIQVDGNIRVIQLPPTLTMGSIGDIAAVLGRALHELAELADKPKKKGAK